MAGFSLNLGVRTDDALCGANDAWRCPDPGSEPARFPLVLNQRAAKVLGVAFSAEEIGNLFARLDLPFTRDGEDFIVKVPPGTVVLAEDQETVLAEMTEVFRTRSIAVIQANARALTDNRAVSTFEIAVQDAKRPT